MNPEHPPLAKLIGAAPLLFMHPKLDTNSIEWQGAYEYDFGFNSSTATTPIACFSGAGRL